MIATTCEGLQVFDYQQSPTVTGNNQQSWRKNGARKHAILNTVVSKREHNWIYRRIVRLPDGTRKRINGTPRRYNLSNTKAAAVEAESRHVAEIMRGEGLANVHKSTLGDFAAVFVETAAANNKPATVIAKQQILRDHLLPRFGSTPLGRIDYTAIEDFKFSLLKSKRHPKTINNVLGVLRRLLVIANKRGEIQGVPQFDWIKSGKPEFDFLDYVEADQLLAGAPVKWRSMILFALRTGLRLGELHGLQWSDVDLIGGRVVVRRTIYRGIIGTPKSGKAREVPLGADAVGALTSLERRGLWVFADNKGQALTPANCDAPLKIACRKAGLRRVGWHVLRHTFASHLAMRGAPIKAIQELMGHATIAMTMRYAHLSPAAARSAVELLDGKASQ